MTCNTPYCASAFTLKCFPSYLEAWNFLLALLENEAVILSSKTAMAVCLYMLLQHGMFERRTGAFCGRQVLDAVMQTVAQITNFKCGDNMIRFLSPTRAVNIWIAVYTLLVSNPEAFTVITCVRAWRHNLINKSTLSWWCELFAVRAQIAFGDNCMKVSTTIVSIINIMSNVIIIVIIVIVNQIKIFIIGHTIHRTLYPWQVINTHNVFLEKISLRTWDH